MMYEKINVRRVAAYFLKAQVVSHTFQFQTYAVYYMCFLFSYFFFFSIATFTLTMSTSNSTLCFARPNNSESPLIVVFFFLRVL